MDRHSPAAVLHTCAQFFRGRLHKSLLASKQIQGGNILTPYVAVESVTECAEIARTNSRVFFTYINVSQACILHGFPGRNQLDVRLPSSTMTAAVLATPPLAALVARLLKEKYSTAPECTASSLLSDRTCLLWSPLPVPSAGGVVAGWIIDPIMQHENQGVVFATMTINPSTDGQDDGEIDDSASEELAGSLSQAECAAFSSERPLFFQHDSKDQTCTIYRNKKVPTTSTSFLWAGTTAPAAHRGNIFPAPTVQLPHKSTELTCRRACIPTATQCFGSIFHAGNQSCALYVAPRHRASSASLAIPSRKFGWTLSSGQKSMQMKSSHEFDTVHVFGTAHQDDHELFMASDVVHAISDAKTKVVFIYMTAGDAGTKDGWWQSRELGTLAATRVLVEAAGHYDATQLIATNGDRKPHGG
ncbi:hypothetical protein AC1031_020085 [Aphanomyces cochlioides]|nr:hypothetical protein AC1031_020085 [Aphanomyces cochlioides]